MQREATAVRRGGCLYALDEGNTATMVVIKKRGGWLGNRRCHLSFDTHQALERA